MRSTPHFSLFVKNCLHRIWNKQFLTFLFFFFLSASFWVFQKLNDTYEREFNMRVAIEDVPSNVDITTGPPPTIAVTLRDKGWPLLNRYWNGLPTLVIHWKDIEGSQGHATLRTRDLMKSFAGNLDGTQIVGYRQETIEVYYNYYSKGKMLAVKFQGAVVADSAYTWIDTEINSPRVMAYGPQEVLDTLQFAYLTPRRFTNVRDTLYANCRLARVRGVKYVSLDANKTVLSSVRVSIITDRMVDGVVEVPVQGLNFPADKTLITNPSKVRVEYKVGLRDYKKITPQSFVIAARYADLINLPGNTFTAQPRSTPPGVRRVRVYPEQVEFIIQENNNETE